MSSSAAAELGTLLRNEADLAFKRRVPLVIDYLDPQPSDRILDAGCGLGFTLKALARVSRSRLVGVDLRASSLDRARRVLGRSAGLVRADLTGLPFGDETFDKVVMTEVLEHLADEQTALAEVRRVLRPRGRLVVSVPNANYPFWWDPLNKTLEWALHTHVPNHIWWLAGIWADHLRLYTVQQLRITLEAAGFEVEEAAAFTHYCLPFHHFLVYGLGKNLIERGLLPEPLARAADRFRSEENAGSLLNPMNALHRLLDWIDRRNDGLTDPRLTFVGLAARARKA